MPAGTSYVLANCFDAIGIPSVLQDDQNGQRELVARLIAAGHRRIADLTLPTHIVATKLWTAGYLAVLAAAYIAADSALIDCADFNSREGQTQILWGIIDRILHLPHPPMALCCDNDKMAMRVYGILRSRGIKVPDEVSVTGYENYRVISETLYPPLTTVELSYTTIGLGAAQQLMAIISDPVSAQAKESQAPSLRLARSSGVSRQQNAAPVGLLN